MNRSTEVLTQRRTDPSSSQENGTTPKPNTTIVLVPWDKQKTYTFLFLSLCFVVWACVYFPLIINKAINQDDEHEHH